MLATSKIVWNILVFTFIYLDHSVVKFRAYRSNTMFWTLCHFHQFQDGPSDWRRATSSLTVFSFLWNNIQIICNKQTQHPSRDSPALRKIILGCWTPKLDFYENIVHFSDYFQNLSSIWNNFSILLWDLLKKNVITLNFLHLNRNMRPKLHSLITIQSYTNI